MPLLEELSIWTCPDCNTVNDVTNPTRCWQCEKKKRTLKQYNALIRKRLREAKKVQATQKAEVVAKIENIPPKIEDHELEFDISKLDPTL